MRFAMLWCVLLGAAACSDWELLSSGGPAAAPDLGGADGAQLADAAGAVDAALDQVAIDAAAPPDFAPPPDLIPACSGWRWNDTCWHIAPLKTNCATACAQFGGLDKLGGAHYGCDVCEHFYGSMKICNVGQSQTEEACDPVGGYHVGAAGQLAAGFRYELPPYQMACPCFH